MKKLIAACTLGATVALAGCSTMHQSVPSSTLEPTIKTPLQADVSVGQEISGEASANVLFSFITLGGPTQFADGVTYGTGSGGLASFLPSTVAGLKSAAALKAVQSANADFIVDPRYTVNVSGFGPIYKTVNVRVTGHAGMINGYSQTN